MKKIAITGGICSGKSTVCKMIEKLGYKVFYSDIEAKKLANTDEDLKREIIFVFGENSYIDGVYNTEYISNIVFSDETMLNTLNGIFSFYMWFEFNRFCKLNSEEEFIFYESALIFEHNRQDEFDKVICIYAHEDIIRRRLKIRNGYTDKQIDDRLSSQMSGLSKLIKTSFHINTSNGITIEMIKNKLK